MSEWETVIGLEVHVELATATKLFCGCANRFGDDPNTNICPTCLGLPGSLPVVNGIAVHYAVRLGRALGCSVERSVFARKNYFYPDMPKDYQVSQYDQPTNVNGSLELPDGSVVGIERAHIEEDTGKSTHMGGGGRIHDAEYSLVDYNRAGVPLVEVVSRPDIRSADQAKAYVAELRGILLATEVSDARMEEGSMRVDANVSIRPVGSRELRTRCEVKNINSLRSLGRAIDYEARRHIDLWSSGSEPHQETRHWDEESGRTTAGRSKEDADDYRYFQEPDLVPFEPDPAVVDELDATMATLPAARRLALTDGSGVDGETAALLVERGQDDLALAAIEAGADPAKTATRVANELAVDDWSNMSPSALAAIIDLESSGALTATQAKQVLVDVVETGDDPAVIIERRGFVAMASDDLEAVVDQVITENPDEWALFCAGDDRQRKKLAGFLTGKVMKATKGQADGQAVSQLLKAKSA